MNNEENVNQNDARAILDGSNGKHKICLLSIIGEVEGHENLSGNTKTTKYDQILPKLAQLEDDDSVEGLLVLLNTSGGDVDAGLAIAEMIASLSMPTVSLVLGGSHSMARITGAGCMLSALCGAFCAAEEDAAKAAVAAAAFWKACSHRAEASAAALGPGHFHMALLDAAGILTAAEAETLSAVEQMEL